jgi:hypothetical protein
MTAIALDPAIVEREPRYVPGFTAIGIVVLAAVAYSVRIALDPTAGTHLLTATFLIANAAGWLLGAALRGRDPRSPLGFLLVLLGDAIFPLNLFAPLLLFVPGLRGDVPMTTTAVIAVGFAYHLWNYWHRSSARFALPFYPYFFALMGGAALMLLHYTAGLAFPVVALLVLAYAIAFNEISHRRRPEPLLHFAIAAATILTVSLGMSAFAFRDRSPVALAALVAGTALLIFSAIRERRDDDATARVHALAAWIGITLTFTAFLYYAHSPLWTYYVATGAWAVVLAIVSTLPARGWNEPFLESAWWAAMLLATALACALWKVWMPLVLRTMPGRPLVEATTLALFEAGVALVLISFWRRRYPAIAATLQGFVANNFLLRLTSYAAPLFLIVALTGAWSIVHAPAPAGVYAPLVAGLLLLIAGPLLERLYPPEALDFAGVLAMILAAFNGLGSAILSAAVLFGAAVIFLVRYLRGAAAWTFAAFLALMAGGVMLQTVGVPVGTAVFLVAAAVVAWASTRATGAMARVGFWAAHIAGFVFWLSLARGLSFGQPFDAVLLATWAWFAFAAARLSRGVASKTASHVSLILAAASVLVLCFRPVTSEVLLVSLLTLAALLLEVRHLHYAGFALLAIAVFQAADHTEGPWLVAVLAGCAAVLLWRSLVRGSSFAHMMFIAAAAGCAVLLMPRAGAFQALPLAILVAVLCIVELLSTKIRTASSFHADLTSVMALVFAAIVLVAEVASARFSLEVLGVLLAAMFAIRGLIVASKRHRVQPVAHAAFGALGLVAAAIAIVAVARMAGLAPSQQVFALACAAWAVLALLLRLPRGTAASTATSVALHLIALGVYGAAYFVRGDDPFLITACVATTGMYLVWRTARNASWLEHFAAVGLIEAVCLWAYARHLRWMEVYLFAVAAYLCVALVRGTAARAQNYVALVLIGAAVAYPYFVLLRTSQGVHLAFLGIASIVVIHVLLTTRRPAVMVVAVCMMLGLGMLFGATVLRGDSRMNLLMALVGFLVIADLGLIGFRADRHTVVGEIDYDDNRVAR